MFTYHEAPRNMTSPYAYFDPTSRLFPAEIQFFMRSDTISRVEVNQALVGDAYLFGYGFEEGDRVFIEPNGDRPLELGSARVFASFGKIIFFAHKSPSVRFHAQSLLQPPVRQHGLRDIASGVKDKLKLSACAGLESLKVSWCNGIAKW